MDYTELGNSIITSLPMIIAAAGWLHQTFSKKMKEVIAENDSLKKRVAVLEANQGDLPRWIRDETGTVISVTPEFVRLFGTPLGYRQEDFIGKKLEELDKFSPDLIAVLQKLDLKALRQGYATAHGINLGGNLYATIIKRIASSTKGTTYYGIAAPEFETDQDPMD